MLYAFMGTGAFGIIMGLVTETFYVTFLGTINLCLGGLVGWLYLTREPRRGRHRN